MRTTIKPGVTMKALQALCKTVQVFVALLDAEMKLEPSRERGGRIAKLTNALEFANDVARLDGLGVRPNKPEAEWITLAQAAALKGISKGSIHHAVTRGAVRSKRLMPPGGRASVVLLLRRTDVEAYQPRAYPRKAAR